MAMTNELASQRFFRGREGGINPVEFQWARD
jgi:hypothetical protein